MCDLFVPYYYSDCMSIYSYSKETILQLLDVLACPWTTRICISIWLPT